MNWLGDAFTSAMCAVLRDNYGIDVVSVDQVTLLSAGSEVPARWIVTSADDESFEVGSYRSGRDAADAQVAVDVSEHCRVHGLPAPKVVSDHRGRLVSPSPTADGGAYTVAEVLPGTTAATAMTVARARSAGTLLGRLHRVLSGYPLPRRQPQEDQVAWQSASLDEVLLAVQAARRHAGTALTVGDRQQLNILSSTRAEAVRHHLAPARRRVTAAPTVHVVHGAFTAENLRYVGDAVTGLTGFRAPTGNPALELARLAFDPFTVTDRDDWTDAALTTVEAYRAFHPYLPATEIRSCADTGLLALLTDPPRHPEGPLQAWETAERAVRRVTDRLTELRSRLDQITAGETPR